MSMAEEVALLLYGDAVIVAEMPLVAVFWRDETEARLPNGLLSRPARLFVMHYSEEKDETRMSPVEWPVVETLAPEAMRRLVPRLMEARERASREYEAEQRERATKSGGQR